MPVSCHFRDCKALLSMCSSWSSTISSTGPLPFWWCVYIYKINDECQIMPIKIIMQSYILLQMITSWPFSHQQTVHNATIPHHTYFTFVYYYNIPDQSTCTDGRQTQHIQKTSPYPSFWSHISLPIWISPVNKPYTICCRITQSYQLRSIWFHWFCWYISAGNIQWTLLTRLPKHSAMRSPTILTADSNMLQCPDITSRVSRTSSSP